jgi:Ca-activated chloride channel family protein
VKFSGFDAYDVEPRTIPDLFAGRPVVVFGKWRGNAGGSVEISGRTGRGPYWTSIAVTPESADAKHGALRHLWARTRIANLTDFAADVDNPDRIAQVSALGLTYGLLTRYTSFIAVEEIVRRTDGTATDVDQPLPLPAGVTDRAVGVTMGDEPELAWVAAIALALFAGTLVSRARRSRVGAAA